MYEQMTGFIFIFSIIATLQLIINFIKSFLSTPPKPIELSESKTIAYGLLIAYMFSYLIYF